MRFLVFIQFIQSLTLSAIWFFSTGAGIAIAYYGFQKSVIWGMIGVLIGFVVAGVLFAIAKIMHKFLFGIIYSIVIPKELKSALKK